MTLSAAASGLCGVPWFNDAVFFSLSRSWGRIKTRRLETAVQEDSFLPGSNLARLSCSRYFRRSVKESSGIASTQQSFVCHITSAFETVSFHSVRTNRNIYLQFMLRHKTGRRSFRGALGY